ncbi:MAG: hypothetical protein A3D92_08015, partial [Bacteroidetes bacterium RIFCSPHIGHO2_02_FULL_44_7]
MREEGIKGRGIFIPRLLFLLLLVVVFPTLAIEAKTIPDGEVTKPLNVEFKQGLFSIDAKEITLGEILAEIEKQSGFTISIDESLKRSPVTVSLSDLDIIKAIHLITSAAGLGGYGISYRSANSPGETGEYIVEMVALLNNGDDVEISEKGLSSNEWIKSLKQSTPSERTRYDKESVKRDKILSKYTVQMDHSFFSLDKTFIPTIKGEKGHILIQLTKELDEIMKVQLSRFGVELLEYIPSNTWKANIFAKSVVSAKSLDFVYAMGDIHPADKFPTSILDNGLSPRSLNRDGTATIQVSFYKGITFNRAQEILAKLIGFTEQLDFITENIVIITIPQENIQSLSELDDVKWIEDSPTPKKADNATAAALSKVDIIQSSPYNLAGSTIKIGEWDSGAVQSDHPDFGGRVTIVDNVSISDHATHVAGTIIGSGQGNSNAKGMAPAATLYSHNYNGDVLAEMASAVSIYGISISNNSWGFIVGWDDNYYRDSKWVWFGESGSAKDSNFGKYNPTSQSWDQKVIDTNLIIVKGAGNDREDTGDTTQSGHHHFGDSNTLYTDYHPPDGDYDSIPFLGCAKNIITVGAVDDARGMSTFSSWGPCDDGRIKPDIVANGVGLTSTLPTNTYYSASGTSMSTPVVTGATALIIQRYKDKFETYPTPHMIKALIVNSAADLGNAGPDYSYGWGLLDAKAAMDLIDGGSSYLRDSSVSNGETEEYSVTVPSSTSVFKVTTVWTDPAGTPGAAYARVNDVDIELVDPVGNIYKPWKLDLSNPSASATSGINMVDNVEQVLVNYPQAGNWTVRIKGSSIQGSQAYAMVSNISFTELITNGGFESNDSGWVRWGSFYADSRFSYPRSGTGYAYLSKSDGTPGDDLIGYIYQAVSIPSSATSATLSFWYNITSQDSSTTANDYLLVNIEHSAGSDLVYLYSNVDKDPAAGNPYYHQKTFDMTPYIGETVRVNFLGTTNGSLPTTFRIDDVSIVASYNKPSVTTLSYSNITSTSATLNGSVNPNGSATTTWFEYGTNSTLSTYTQTPAQSIESGSTSQTVSANLNGLNPSTTYYYRLVASNSAGTQYGSILNFTTQKLLVITRTLTISSSNPNSGVSITVSPNDNNGSNNGTTPFTRTYNDKTSITLTAPSTAGGNNFQKWQRDGVDYSTNTSTSVTMDADHTMTAVYVTPPPIQYQLTTSVSPSGAGSINPNCSLGCSYTSGTSVTLTATANSGYSFSYWNGCDSSSGTICYVTMNSNKTVTAYYVDTIAPTITSTNPTNNATNVLVNTAITANFSENVDLSTIVMSLKQGTTYISGIVTSTLTAAIFQPSTNLAYNTTYTVTIAAGLKDLSGNTMTSDYTWSFTTEAQPPGPPLPPANITAIAGDGQIIISWDAVSNATSYNIYWSTIPGVTKSTGMQVPNVTSPYIHTGLTNDTTYYYVVTATNSYGEGSESSRVSATLQSGWTLSTIESSENIA